jgi:large subunit ribosomal protein L16
MPLMPKRVEHRKSQKRRVKGNATRGNYVAFGEYGLQALEPGYITARQLEAGRVAATHFMSREGRLWIRVFPQKPITAKPLETRMGKGKGEVAYWVAVVKPGTVIYEVGGIGEDEARQTLNRMAHKLPVRVKLVRRRPTL